MWNPWAMGWSDAQVEAAHARAAFERLRAHYLSFGRVPPSWEAVKDRNRRTGRNVLLVMAEMRAKLDA